MELEQQTKFDLLVRQLERSTRHRKTPNYQLRVAALAAIGYGYIGMICLDDYCELVLKFKFRFTEIIIAMSINLLRWLVILLYLICP